MRRMVIVASAAVLVLGAQLLAGPTRPTLSWGSQVNAGVCNTSGAPVINVTFKVINDADSGQSGNYWAFDSSNKSIQVWAQTDGTYCAVVKYAGKFDAVAGQTSPGNLATPLTGKEDGTFEGGYIATIDGTLLAAPSWKTRGNLGTFDYQCDITGNCPGAPDWLAAYFTNVVTFDQTWWGWIYHGVRNSWVNSSDGNLGDVLK
jgi:hypothetical protein